MPEPQNRPRVRGSGLREPVPVPPHAGQILGHAECVRARYRLITLVRSAVASLCGRHDSQHRHHPIVFMIDQVAVKRNVARE